MNVKKIEKLIQSVNIAEGMPDDELALIGARVTDDYDVDLESRAPLDKTNREAMELAKQVYEKKTFPWPDAANVKYPLITVAAIQFASRAYPELVPDENIVNTKVLGADPDEVKQARGERVSKYMNFQVTEDIDNWLDGTDRLLHVLPIVGTCFRKVYYDPLKEKVVSKFLTYDDVIVNSKAESLGAARRVSHKLYKYNNFVKEMVLAGVWSDHDLGEAESEDADIDAPHLFIEQHRWLDLDKDGYEEPYIVTVHKESNKVMRIVARYDAESLKLKAGSLIRINPIQYFIKYPFIPNPDGGFYDIGFGTLLHPINGSINTVINQLLDSGTLANTGGGFLSRGIKLASGSVRFKPGEWKHTDVMGQDLRQGILPLPVRDPSQVLFQLLGLLITAGKDISSVQEAMSGQKPGENVSAATVTALIEQGLKVFSGIYKRIYRSLTAEFKLIFRLNAVYLNKRQYIAVLDENIQQDDFTQDDFDIKPSAEPEFSLDTQRVGRAEALLKISGRPGLDEDAITAGYLKAIKVPERVLLPKEDRPQPPPDPEMLKLELEQERFELERKEAHLRRMKLFAEIEKLRADAILQIAKAEGEEEGVQLESYKLFVQDLGTKMEEMRNADSGSTQGMAPERNNQGSNSGGPGATPVPGGSSG